MVCHNDLLVCHSLLVVRLTTLSPWVTVRNVRNVMDGVLHTGTEGKEKTLPKCKGLFLNRNTSEFIFKKLFFVCLT